jgi:hypothetical protein
MGAGLVLLFAGQFAIFSAGNVLLGGILTFFCVLFFILAITEKYIPLVIFCEKTLSTIKDIIKKAKMAEKTAVIAVAPAAKSIKKAGTINKLTIVEKSPVDIKQNPVVSFFKGIIGKKDGINIKFSLPKWLFFAVAALLFGAAQYFFIKENLKFAVMILIVDAILLVSTLIMKGRALDVEFKIDSGLKVLSCAAGIIMVFLGWLLLIKQNIQIQEWGVVLSIPGAILLFLGLPKSDSSLVGETDRTDILFMKPDFLNNYIVKGIMLLVSFALLKIGVKVMQSPDYNMYSMLFYAATGIILFFVFPIFNFSEKQYDNKILDFIKLGVVIAALAVAYNGQTLFVKHDINNAVNHYFIAAIMFIFAFPIYAAKANEEKEVFPIKIEIIFLVVITLIGAFLRFYELDVRPFGIENDEAGGLTARMTKSGETTLNLTVGNFGIYAHIVRVFIALFGGMDRVGIKFMPVIVGILAIPVIYFLIRDMFNPRIAMFVTVIFTFLRWNVYYSRYTSPVIMSLCTEALALYFFFKAIETRKKFIWFLAGLCIGITWHGPMTFFLLIIPFTLYLIITSMAKKGYFKANVIGMLAFMCGFWIFGSMILHNYFISQRIYFGRVAEVSVFSKDPNAPSKNVAKGIVENTKQVMLMFNNMGDSRQRNSGGQPLEPTVDFLTSMFFAIGFLYALYYSKYYQFFIMLMVFFSQAAGSIFSIEAPSAMRAVGTMIPMIFFIALAFDKIWMALRRAIGKKFEMIYMPVIMLMFLIPIAKENYFQYFQRWIGGLDELSTAAGMYSAKLGNKTRVVLYTSLYYPGHPPYRFFRWDYKVNSADRFTTGMVRLREITDEDFAIFFHYDTWNNMSSIQRTMFPESKITIVDHKFFNKKLKEGEGFGTLLKVMEIKNAEIQKVRGLNGAYSFGGAVRTNEPAAFDKADDGRLPYNVTWKGELLVPYYGKFRIYNGGNAPVNISIDGLSAASSKEIILAEGFHKITVSASKRNLTDKLDLMMDAKQLEGNIVQKTEVIQIDKKYLYNFPSFGLHAYFYKGAEWTGNPIKYEVISTNMCFGGGGILTESAIWRGTIKIPDTDVYNFTTRSNGYIRIVIDGKYYWEQAAGDAASTERATRYFAARRLTKVNNFNLTAGRHAIEIYAMNASLLELVWAQKAHSEPVSVPVDALEPDYKITSN